MDDEPIVIRLSEDQALVLSDWLERLADDRELSRVVDDRAVWSSLLAISGTLEATLTAIFQPDYGERLEDARQRLLDSLGEFGLDKK
ncbi:hypothetical protein [Microtetraspora malaysiensis]|uniref:hypothetical protein n=1 Tax=Microtetraspora malaysiensis TaxID=161358 RepID=UPI003D9405AE